MIIILEFIDEFFKAFQEDSFNKSFDEFPNVFWKKKTELPDNRCTNILKKH